MGRAEGLHDQHLQDLARYRESDAFSDLEKLVLDLATAMTRTPTDVPEQLFGQLQQHFSARQLVELTTVIAQENFRARFNRPFDVSAAGFSEGAFCPLPER